jgi:subtilisin family serine protease
VRTGAFIWARPLSVILLALVIPRSGLGQEPEYVPGEVVVRYEAGVTAQEIRAIETRFDLAVISELPHLRLRHYELPQGVTVEATIEQLTAMPEVESVEPNVIHRLQGIPSDPLFGEQWGLNNTGQTVQGIAGLEDADIDWPEAMDLLSPSDTVTVAVIDSGVAIDHPEILANTWVNLGEVENGVDDDGNGYVDDLLGWNFIDGHNLPLDDLGHGTGVASVVAGVCENGEGGSGVAPNARIMALRVADELQGFGSPVVSLMNFLLATTYAAENGARIINFSAVGAIPTTAQETQIEWLDSQGVLLVAAAGNGDFVGDGAGDDNDLFPLYPASYTTANIIAVAATNQSDELTSFSNYGAVSVDLAAPGSNIFVADVNRTFPLVESFEGTAPGWTVGHSCPYGCPDWTFFVDALFNSWASDGSEDPLGYPVNYLPWTDSWLDSPAVPLVFGPVLLFREWHALSSGDELLVQISTDGVNWNTLATYTGFSTSPAPGTSPNAGDLRLFDLTPYEGQTVQISFRLITDGVFQADGAYVDNVVITQVDLFQYDGTQYDYVDGTSFSAPMVAGVAALLMSHRPDLTHHEIREAILNSVDPLGSLSGKLATGGRLNAHNAIQYVPEPSALVLQAAGIGGLFVVCSLRRKR